MARKPPSIFDEEIDPDKEIPKYGNAIQRIIELQLAEEKRKQEEGAEDFTAEGDVDLPERPGKRIKEKFRKDREEIEKRLNARGDSLYRSKLQEMQNPWAGAPGVGWGGNQQSNTSPWPGWPGPAQSSYPGWGFDSPAQESPFGRTIQEEENKGDIFGNNSMGENIFGSESDNKLDNEFNDQEDDSDNEPNSNDNSFTQAAKAFNRGEIPDEDKADAMTDFSEDEFRKGPLESRPAYAEDGEEGENAHAAVMKAGEEAQDGNEIQEGDSAKSLSNEEDLDPYGRPKKKLKEKFMKDREELEKMLNAKGESIYRKANEPPPATVQAPPGAGDGKGLPFTYPEKRILGPEDLRAHMAFQRIAKAMAKVASKRRGRKGRTSIVFI